MGQRLTKWAARISGIYGLNPLDQVVLLNMAVMARDPDANTKGKEKPCEFWLSREKLAANIYGDTSKSHNLDRPIRKLRELGMIEPIGRSACRGVTQTYKLNIEILTAAAYDRLCEIYSNEAQELGRIQRRASRG